MKLRDRLIILLTFAACALVFAQEVAPNRRRDFQPIVASGPADPWSKFNVNFVAEDLALNNDTSPCLTPVTNWVNHGGGSITASNQTGGFVTNAPIGIIGWSTAGRWLSNAVLPIASIFTVSATIQYNTTATTTNQLLIWGDAAKNNGLFLVNDGSILVKCGGTNFITVALGVTNLIHPITITVTCDGASLITYTNGVALSTNTVAPAAWPLTLIGSYDSSAALTAGLQKLHAATNYPMIASEVLCAYQKDLTYGVTNPTSGLIAWVRCDEGSGTNLHDYSVTAQAVTVFGPSTNSYWTNDGPFTNGIVFTGGADNQAGILLAGNTNLLNTNGVDYTVAHLLRVFGTEATSHRGYAWGKNQVDGNNPSLGASFRESSGSIRFGGQDNTGGNGWETAIANLGDGAFHLVVQRYICDAGTPATSSQEWLDAVPILTANSTFGTFTTNSPIANTNNIIIMNADDKSYGLIGETSWYMVWNRRLSAIEMRQLYHLTQPGYYTALAALGGGTYPG